MIANLLFLVSIFILIKGQENHVCSMEYNPVCCPDPQQENLGSFQHTL